MSNSNEKLVAGIAALIPIARNAFMNGNLNRQFNAVMSNDTVRHAGSKWANQAERYVRGGLKKNKYTRQIVSQFAPRPSPVPAIALAVVGAGLVWAYLNARRQVRRSTPDHAMANGKADMESSGVTFDARAMPNN